MTLKAYIVLTVLWPAASALLGGRYLVLLGVPFGLLIGYFLLSGVRWLWWVMTVVSVISVLLVPLEKTAWYIVAGDIITLLLLLLPDTRRHFFGPRFRPPVGVPSDHG